MKNILQVCAYAAMYEGNFITTLKALDLKLTEKGYTTVYAFPEKARDIEWCRKLSETRKVYFLPLSKARIKPKTYRTLRKIMKEEKIDIVHSHFELYDVPIALSKPENVKMFWHLHDPLADGFDERDVFHKLLIKSQYKLFSRDATLISVSEKHMRFVIGLGFNEKNAVYLPNGIQTERFKTDSTVTKKYDFLIFAWSFERKGGDVAVKAAEMLEKKGLEFTIGFVGTDATWSNPTVEKVVAKPYFVKQEFVSDVNELYNATKAFLHLSRAEGCSYALEEALYTGLPVVCSDIEENGFAKEFPTAFTVNTSEIDTVVSAMERLIKDNFTISENAVTESKRLIEDKYSIDAWVKEMSDIYEGAAK